MAKNYTITIEEKEFTISFTNKTVTAISDMGLEVYPIYGTLLALGKELLNLKHQENFIVIDEYQRLGIVGYKDCNTSAIDIVSVVHMDNIYVKKDVKVIKYN